MIKILTLLVSNAVVVTGLLGVGLLADRFMRWPAIRHLVWVALLFALLVPPIISVRVSLPELSVTQGAVIVSTVADLTQQLPVATSAYDESVAVAGNSWTFPSLATVAMFVELLGAALFLGLALFRSRRLSMMLRATQAAPDELLQRARRLGRVLGLRALPRIRVTNDLVTPMLIALPTPTIVLSRQLIESLGDTELDGLLSHELAHTRRGDAWLRPVETLATALYWWLPTLYLVRRRLRRAEEAACDAMVVSANPAGKRAYAESLLKTIELTSPTGPASLVSRAADSHDLKERIVMILKHSNNRTPRYALWLASSFVLLACSVGPTWVAEQEANGEISSAQERFDNPQEEFSAVIKAIENTPEDFEPPIEALVAEYRPLNPDEYRPLNPDEYRPLNSDEYRPLNSDEYRPLNPDEYRPLNPDEYRPVNFEQSYEAIGGHGQGGQGQGGQGQGGQGQGGQGQGGQGQGGQGQGGQGQYSVEHFVQPLESYEYLPAEYPDDPAQSADIQSGVLNK